MKTYQSRTKESKRNFFKRHKYAIAAFISMSAVAATVVLSVMFTRPVVQPTIDVVVDPPAVDVNTKPAVVLPMTNARVGMEYSADKIVKWETLDLWQWHPAVDFVGSGDVVSVLDGKIIDIEKTSIDGNVVTIEHSGGYISIYKSLAGDIAVKIGDTVKAGDKIGTSSVSMMSESNTGAHLHFELKKNGTYVDPSTVIPISNDK